MGRPLSAVFNLFLTGMLFWIPGVRHALVCYADWKATQQFGQVVEAINKPAYTKQGQQVVHVQAPGVAAPSSNPYVGRNGTVYGQRP